jgi:transcriptional regulator with XRE-family HTH domain
MVNSLTEAKTSRKRDSAGDPQLGRSIRARRQELGMSLAEVAVMTGLTSGAISQIERGVVNPSVQTLRRISGALRVPTFAFLDGTGEPKLDGIVVRADHRKRLAFPGQQIFYELMSPNLDGKMEVLWYEIPVGDSTFEGGFAHSGEECCVILQGSGRLDLPGESYELSPGDAATYDAGLRHALVNIGDLPLVAISCIAPPSF